MTYDFSFDQKSIGFLLVGVVFVCILLFLAGWLTGANWNKPETLVASTSADKSVAALEPTQPALPKEPTLREEAALRRDTATAQAGEAIAPAKQNPVAPSLDAEREAERQSPKTAAQKGNDDPLIISTAKPEAASPAEVTEPMEKIATFSIQVGVFLEEKDAERFVEEMEQKGYAPSVFTGSDAENRIWYSVRIGAYADRTEAAQAAASFIKQEKIKAVVRPIDSL